LLEGVLACSESRLRVVLPATALICDIGRMRPVDEHSAESYLRDSGRIAPDESVRARELGGGVSNMVLLVERPERPGGTFVLKQARAQLRTVQPWFSSVERNWREADVLAICTRLLERSNAPSGASCNRAAQTPRILFEDRDNYLFAMTAAPRPNTVWKDELLAGKADRQIAVACGRLLATLHGESWLDAGIAERLGDRTLFDQLRVDPYYRTLAAARPETRPAVERLIDSLAAHPRSLVHADFSPKNLLIFSGGLMMVDFETGHFGDPAFDLGFFLSHLVLKACYHIPRHAAFLEVADAFRQSYCETMAAKVAPQELSDLWARGLQNLAGCAWARLDGKSPVEYLSDPPRREQIRALCREIFQTQPRDWPAVTAACRRIFSLSQGGVT
jgi:5-methylthioribose kinase